MTEPVSSKFQIRLPMILASVLAAGMFIGQQLPHSGAHTRFVPAGSAGKVSGTIDEVLKYIDSRYVDTIDVNNLKADAINHLLDQLDPHSVYITPDELQAVDDDMSGGFEGIGVEFIMLDDTIQVVTPLAGGPSEAAGILAGDKFISINDTIVAGVKIDNGKIFKKLRGTKGSKVKIAVKRGQDNNLHQFTIARDVIPVKSVEVSYMLDEQTGYVKINRFSARTYQEFMDAIGPMAESKHMQNLVLDLRGNPGGFLNEATDLLSQLFPEGKLLVYTKGRTEERRDYKSNGRARFNIKGVAVLIDEGSASASEIVAGALQDHDRAWIIGRRSFGKGLVQEQYPLSDGGALRLTIARYFTPSGRCIQRDYKHDKDYEHEAERRLKSGELSDGSRIKPSDSTRYYTGMGRIVFGGGGISPDIFVPIDTSYFNSYFFELRQHLPQFAARWMDGRDKSTLPSDLSSFMNGFNVDDNLFRQFLEFSEKEGVHRNDKLLGSCQKELKHQIKARIARILFQDPGQYAVLNSDDPAVLRAMEVLKSGAPIGKK